jgi:hypothetical protein
MEVQHTVACSKHCCCLDAGEFSLFRVSKFQALVEDIIIIIISSSSSSSSSSTSISIIIITDLFIPVFI